MAFRHIPVMLRECIDALNIRPDGVYFDGTAGGAGHSVEIAKRLSTGRLIAADCDPDAVAAASERLNGLPATVVNDNFANVKRIAERFNIAAFDGAMLDLGVSSHQLDTPARGFSYSDDAPLDMRMSRSGETAADFINTAPRDMIAKVLRDYGEEKYADAIASSIVRARAGRPVETTGELANIVIRSVPPRARRDGNPARRTFQAVRIYVNNELGILAPAVGDIFDLLAPGGRLAVITFHSLEDRTVKNAFRDFCTGCVCPPDLPVCVCGRKPRGKLLFQKPVVPSREETENNPRARSAKLRVIEKI